MFDFFDRVEFKEGVGMRGPGVFELGSDPNGGQPQKSGFYFFERFDFARKVEQFNGQEKHSFPQVHSVNYFCDEVNCEVWLAVGKDRLPENRESLNAIAVLSVSESFDCIFEAN